MILQHQNENQLVIVKLNKNVILILIQMKWEFGFTTSFMGDRKECKAMQNDTYFYDGATIRFRDHCERNQYITYS